MKRTSVFHLVDCSLNLTKRGLAPAGGAYPTILTWTDSESPSTATLEFLATKNADGAIIVMVANRAVHSSPDNHGTGDPRTTVLDVSALGNFSSALQMNMDASTDMVLDYARFQNFDPGGLCRDFYSPETLMLRSRF